MPFIHTKTSCPISKEAEKQLAADLGRVIRLLPGKSEQWLMLQFEENCELFFQGKSDRPMAFVNVKIYGSAPQEAYDRLTGEITRLLSDRLSIAPNCVYVAYEETPNWGWNGSNF